MKGGDTVINNPTKYDDKVPTNVRLEADLKELAMQEAEQRKVPLTQIVNEALRERYNKGE